METSPLSKLQQLQLELSELKEELKHLPHEIAELDKIIQEKRKRLIELNGRHYGSQMLIQYKQQDIEQEIKNESNSKLPNPVCDQAAKYVIIKVTSKRIYLREIHGNNEFYVSQHGNEYNRCKNFDYAATREVWEDYKAQEAIS